MNRIISAGCLRPLLLNSWQRRILIGFFIIALAGCNKTNARLNDDEKIVHAILGQLTLEGQAICLDDQTSGNSLTIFREMAHAPRASRQELKWYHPTSLRPDTLSVRKNYSWAERESSQNVAKLAEPTAGNDALSDLEQMMLNGAALRLSNSVSQDERSVALRSSWIPDNSDTRWWPLNRLHSVCRPIFTLGNPIRRAGTAFISVQAGHSGTLYALKVSNGNWVPVAEWSRWLY